MSYMNKPSDLDSGIMKDVQEIQELAAEIQGRPTCCEDEPEHICPHCESTDARFDSRCGEYWCGECWVWFSESDDKDSESRDDIARRENAILDRENRK